MGRHEIVALIERICSEVFTSLLFIVIFTVICSTCSKLDNIRFNYFLVVYKLNEN
jgi:hypothetical protein